jgi:hypothetical protein
MLRIWPPILLQMINARFHLLIDHAGAEIRETAGTTIAEAIEEVMAPVTLAVRVVLVATPWRTPGNIGIHATLGHRLRLIEWWTSLVALRRRGNFFAKPCL